MVITKKINKFMRITIDYLLKNPEAFQEKLAQGDINVLKLFFSFAEKYIDMEKNVEIKNVSKSKKMNPRELEELLNQADRCFINYQSLVKK